VPGRELEGVHFAMEYLYGQNRAVADAGASELTAAGKPTVDAAGLDKPGGSS